MPSSNSSSEPAHTANSLLARPVLITGITPRSGTNYLHRLLLLHPDCAPLKHDPVQEDFLLHHADALVNYADRLSWQWGHWGNADPVREKLIEHLGRGLSGFLEPKYEAAAVLTKTPSVRNIDRFFDLFPQGRLLVIVRDGRSVVASAIKGFDWDFEPTARRWARAARTVLDLRDTYGQASDQHRILYYEDLNADPASNLKQIFQLLDLEVDAYDFSEALNLPVYGSSFVTSDDETVTWQPTDKPESFNSERRWASWTNERHARFNWIGGTELARLGYETKETPLDLFDRLRHYATDCRYEVSQLPSRLRRSAQKGAYAFWDAFRDRS